MTAATIAAAPTASARHLAGTPTLIRLALRRDRVLIPVWVVALVGTLSSTERSLEKLYDTAAERADVAHDMNANGSFRALYGAVYADSYGALTVWRVGATVALLAGLMSVLVVIRHTRDEEETGRQEALSAAMVGRRAPLTAALVGAALANLALLVLCTAVLRGAGQPTAGSLAFGTAVALTGMVFAGIAAVAAQLTENTRLARGIAVAALGVAFVLRAAGDAARPAADGGSHPLVWATPLGWAENVRPFAGDRWWALLPSAALAAGCAVLAYALAGRRDIGAGFIRPRPGPAHAPSSLAGVYGLAWRLHRGTLAAWAVGLAFGGAVFGGIADGAKDIVGDNDGTRDLVRRMGGHVDLTDAFLSTLIGLLGLICVVFAAGSILRLRDEETAARAEPLLANAVGRLRWAGGHLLAAYLGTAVVLTAGGLAMGLSYGITVGDVSGQLPRVLLATLAQTPAVWVMTGLAVLIVGALPRLTPAVWGLVGLVIALGWLGPALKLPQALLDVSPFAHLPKLPGADVTATPYAYLLTLAAILPIVGLTGLRHRDLD
ncbi:ABC transporter permease [Embleya scabrispora]|uniref:ABC transporter permease n=1 Tax=Embleya scabrispora TaxID=159449 RepID=A0A1T3P4S7_9ACTN|nr:ABC transporter permease [Embleya scabrispora]OPC83962.1 ABC transporter permease [Embleya scabrispora]